MNPWGEPMSIHLAQPSCSDLVAQSPSFGTRIKPEGAPEPCCTERLVLDGNCRVQPVSSQPELLAHPGEGYPGCVSPDRWASDSPSFSSPCPRPDSGGPWAGAVPAWPFQVGDSSSLHQLCLWPLALRSRAPAGRGRRPRGGAASRGLGLGRPRGIPLGQSSGWQRRSLSRCLPAPAS